MLMIGQMNLSHFLHRKPLFPDSFTPPSSAVWAALGYNKTGHGISFKNSSLCLQYSCRRCRAKRVSETTDNEKPVLDRYNPTRTGIMISEVSEKLKLFTFSSLNLPFVRFQHHPFKSAP